MDVFIDIINQTDGRDKVTKTIQYTIKLLIYLIRKYAKSNTERFYLNSWKSITKLLSDSRRVYRLGNAIKEVHAIKELVGGEKNNVLTGKL